MAYREIIYNKEILAKLIRQEDWNEGLGFYSNDDEFIQVGSWNYDEGKELQRHIHNEVSRTITRTNEVLHILQEKLKAKIYSLDEKFVEEIIINAGETLILLNCGHGYEIMEDDTKVLEIKNGPYLGAETDRRRF